MNAAGRGATIQVVATFRDVFKRYVSRCAVDSAVSTFWEGTSGTDKWSVESSFPGTGLESSRPGAEPLGPGISFPALRWTRQELPRIRRR